MKEHVRNTVQSSKRRGLTDPEAQIGRRAGWYALVRALRPNHVVETGTDKGLGSVVIASALMKNGQGQLTTVDIHPEAGFLVVGPYSEVVNVVIGDSIEVLGGLPPDVGLFIHDSDHSAEHEAKELEAVQPRLMMGAHVLSDNAHATDVLANWARNSSRRFLYFQEVPDGHWYRGAGIGAAW